MAALTDVQDPDPTHFVENLDAVVRSMNDEAALTSAGVDGAVAMMAVALRNRIEVDRYVADEPGIEDSTLEPPIFLTGLPRSGTTYFQYLFDTDVEGPQECLAILDQTFVNPGLLWTMSVAGYLEFLLHDADLRAAYEYHARALKLLQWGAAPRRWALKWPCHLLALDAIARVHPDAHFVVTHRDPVQALASNCSLTHMLRAGTSPNADPEQIGRDMLELVRQHVDRLVAFDIEQEKAGRSALVHVDYYRLVDAPEAVMPEVFEAIGLEWSPEVDERIRAWREANPKGQRGKHEYRLDDYGLDRGAVTDAFAGYTARFDIPSEDAHR